MHKLNQIMKKVYSISLIVLTLAAMVHLSVATHYCQGKIAGTRVSLSGKTASCGMADDKNDVSPAGLSYSSHCCKNVVVAYGITCKYFPSFSSVPDTFQLLIKHFNAPDKIVQSYLSSSTIHSDKSPPHNLFYHGVDLSDICILRI
jgi:hypothetical protein